MALFEVIKFDGLKSRDWLFYKYPLEDINIGSQLVVQEGQAAIFVKQGSIADIFYAGTHTLSTENLPILKGIINIPFGGRTPFTAEIYYVNLTIKLDVHWGTTDPIQLIDPKYYVKLRIRAFGQMGLKIIDPLTLFQQLIGGMQKSDIVSIDKIKEYYRGILVIKAKTAIANTIINNNISALEITTKLEQLSNEVKEAVAPSFEEYGLNMVNFFIQSINFPDEDFEKINKILEDKAAFEIMGDSRYATKRSFDVYEGAANNQSGVAGAFVAGGFGLGAAMNVGSKMNEVVGNPVESKPNKVCYSCGSHIPENAKFCFECGANNSIKICECGNKLLPGSKFCPECGKKVE